MFNKKFVRRTLETVGQPAVNSMRSCLVESWDYFQTQCAKMDAISKALDKIQIPKSFDGFLKSDTQSQLVVTGIAGCSLF